MTPYLARIAIFPIKSLDGQEVEESPILRSGGLAHDREYCLVDAEGSIVNGKRLGAPLLRIRSEVDLAFGEVRLRHGGESGQFHLCRERKQLEKWLAGQLAAPLQIKQDPDRGFPDDTEAAGPTLVSTATLETVASWYGFDLEEARRRFRANLEIGGVPAFWEDLLVGANGAGARFRIGDVLLEGRKLCARCTVPSLDSRTGELHNKQFAKTFAGRRRESLPEWAERSRFDHFFRLAVNTSVAPGEAAKVLQAGDELTLVDGAS